MSTPFRTLPDLKSYFRSVQPLKSSSWFKIGSDQIVGALGASGVHLGCGGAYHIAIDIECVKEAEFIEMGVRLKSPQRILPYEK